MVLQNYSNLQNYDLPYLWYSQIVFEHICLQLITSNTKILFLKKKKHKNIIQWKEIPRKTNGITMMHWAMRPKKKTPSTDSVLPLLYVFDLGRDSTASDHMRSHWPWMREIEEWETTGDWWVHVWREWGRYTQPKKYNGWFALTFCQKKQKVNKNLAQMTKKNFNQTSKWCIYGWFALNFLLPFSQYKFIKSATKIFTRWQNENGIVSFHTCTFKNLVTTMTF